LKAIEQEDEAFAEKFAFTQRHDRTLRYVASFDNKTKQLNV
jgi:hypothetical protein